jgi:L-lactate dehydrogenase complex protein LldE
VHVSLFITCLTDTFLPRGGVAVVKVLEHLGHTVAFPSTQTCCGQPMFTTGFHDEAAALARRMVEVFRGAEAIVTPSGSCAAMVREHFADLFPAGSKERREATELAGRTWEFVEFLNEVAPADLAGAKWDGAVTIHDSCHLRGIGLEGGAAKLLGRIEGLTCLPVDDGDRCCGFGGVFATKYPAVSGLMVDDKVSAVQATGARTVVSSDAGCTMNMAGACRRGGADVRFCSAAEIVAESLGLLERPTEGAV